MRLFQFFFKKIAEEFQEIRFASASLAFYTLFAFIPFLLIVVASLQKVGIFDQIYPIVDAFIFDIMKEATGNTVTQYLRNTISKVNFKTVGFTGIIILIATIVELFRNIDYAFHQIWGIKTRRPYFKRTGIYWAMILLMPAVVLVISWINSLKALGFTNQVFGDQFNIFIIGTFSLWVIYTFIPTVKVNIMSSLVAALIAGSCLALLQSSFLWMALKLFKQNKIYGSLASFPIFLLWLNLVWIIILSGVSLCAFLQQKLFKRS